MAFRKKRFVRRRKPARRPARRFNRKRPVARKRTFKRKPKQGTSSVTIRTMGIPDVVRQRFLYSENNYRLSLATTDDMLSFAMSLNDPWDPYAGVGGKAALHWPQVMGQYKYCRTYGAKITIRLVDNVAANTIPMVVAFVLSSTTDNQVPADIDDLLAWPRSRKKMLKMYPNRIGSTRTLSMYVNIADVFQYPRDTYDNILPGTTYDNTNVGAIASPTQFAICNVFYAKLVNNATAIDAFADINIKYYCKFHVRLAFGEEGLGHGEVPPLAAELSEDTEEIHSSYIDELRDLETDYSSKPQE